MYFKKLGLSSWLFCSLLENTPGPSLGFLEAEKLARVLKLQKIFHDLEKKCKPHCPTLIGRYPISVCCGTWTFPGERKLRNKWGSMPS